MVQKIGKTPEAFMKNESLLRATFPSDDLNKSYTSTLTALETSVLSKVWTKVLSGCSSIFNSVKTLFQKIFFCFSWTQTKEDSLKSLKKLNSEFKSKVETHKNGQLSPANLKKWWSQEYNSLHSSAREMLLLEDVQDRAPEKVGLDTYEWAKSNIDEHRAVAMDFVGNLIVQTNNGQDSDPLEDVQIYIHNAVRRLER